MDLTAGKLRCDLAAKLTREQLVYYVIELVLMSIFAPHEVHVFSQPSQPLRAARDVPLLKCYDETA